jgi:hypothetical protein
LRRGAGVEAAVVHVVDERRTDRRGGAPIQTVPTAERRRTIVIEVPDLEVFTCH